MILEQHPNHLTSDLKMSKITVFWGFAIWASMMTFVGATFADDTVEDDITNVGFVLYTKSHAPGTLNARWLYSTQYRGVGIATGGPPQGYAGQYHVRYYFEDGAVGDEYDLHIKKVGPIYHVDWLADGQRKATGVGMETAEGLSVGWMHVSDGS